MFCQGVGKHAATGRAAICVVPDKYIYDVAGFPKIRAQELVDRLKEQLTPFNPTIGLEEKVIDVIKNQEGLFEITTDTSFHRSGSIIITAGAGAHR